MDSTEVIERVTVNASEYRHLVEICVAAEIYLRTESPEALDSLRDAVLVKADLLA